MAIVVLAVGILGVFASFAFGLHSTSSSARLSEAVGYARQVVELIRSRNLPFQTTCPPPQASGLNDPASLEWSQLPVLNAAPFANDLPPNSDFRRRIQVRRESGNSADYRFNVAEIYVSVLWMEKGHLRSVELTAHYRKP